MKINLFYHVITKSSMLSDYKVSEIRNFFSNRNISFKHFSKRELYTNFSCHTEIVVT